ncbi:HlyD family type I secretion periplasmic adaptor subunit [Methylobacillus gramineus]|uniref:HlyD family type I secretion periplasmic adaptor subunit n=1 Tax=Methylobacillus gramineus TaxID=755169 RepID=UPI001CFFDE0A|nr:HlyD family type I secretion periplasmic adaptor subunit [Methylobacillus gramineus]MCB5185932.1 HlyD family type I secretion periplasmic adaptor subunit [Methylobacillus gramineus]
MSWVSRQWAAMTPQRAFVLVVVLAVASLLTWAALAQVDLIVRTVGRVVPAGKAQIVQHLEGGIVRTILVQEGEVVKAGQPLVELTDIKVRSDLGQERTKRDSLRGREARLLAEARGKTSIDFPVDLHDPEVRQVESAALQARVSSVNEESRVLRDQSAQRRGEIAEIETRRKNLVIEIDLARQQHKLVDGLQKNGAASKMELLDAESRLQRMESQLKEAEATLPRLRAAQSESESKIGELWARFRADATAQLTDVRAELQRSTLEFETSADRLDRNVVRAPMAGFINRMMLSTVGGVIRPGEPLLEITPEDEHIVVETKSRPDDRANLRNGLPARVRIGAFDYATYGALPGKVTEVSADTLFDEHEGYYYRVRVDVGSISDIKLAKAAGPISPGMSVTADIVVGKRTVLSYLLSPMMRFGDRVFRDPR